MLVKGATGVSREWLAEQKYDGDIFHWYREGDVRPYHFFHLLAVMLSFVWLHEIYMQDVTDIGIACVWMQQDWALGQLVILPQ